ncbi:hypothetical protein PSTG_08042 [Puccinia striiformis f. sp. tritici PST-78]|uniref:Uncharacterized protein n=3 Tax=Puccinia striiformis TaxID=27350 RepID=A0A0L0VHA8_9BASI|nr:hypothetical protein PSTG_08042 [Puccinia striiformis f. sp. tritici PST-78]
MGIDLVHHQHTFVLAGTGFGETRITEVYWHLFPVYRKPVLMVLNPLDTLSDNEVPEKKAAKFEAVNLTKMNIMLIELGVGSELSGEKSKPMRKRKTTSPRAQVVSQRAGR